MFHNRSRVWKCHADPALREKHLHRLVILALLAPSLAVAQQELTHRSLAADRGLVLIPPWRDEGLPACPEPSRRVAGRLLAPRLAERSLVTGRGPRVTGHELPAQQKSAYRYLAPVFAHGRILLAATDKYVVVAMDTANASKGARFPVVVPVGGRSLAILTGAVEWFDLMDENAPGIEAQTWLGSAARVRPSTRDSGKPDDRPRPTLGQPRLDRGQSTVTHIEVMTEAIAEKLHDYAVDYHSKAEVPKGAPLLSVLWAGWGEDGPVVWTARYDFTQEWLAENFYQTRLERPRTRDLLKSPEGIAFAEEGYPEAGNLLALLERLEAHDPALEKLWSQPSMALVLAARKAGKGKKITAQQAADFCRALLQASTDSRASATGPATAEKPLVGVLLVDEEGARWIHKP